MALAALSTSCLVSSAPPLEGEEQVSPRIVLNNASPPPFSIVQTTSDTGVGEDLVTTFQVDFWSEDLDKTEEVDGEENENPIRGFLYLNYSHAEIPTVLGTQTLAGGSLSDAAPRTMAIPWNRNRNQPPDCYILTMIIGHQEDFDGGNQLPYPAALDRVAFITWVVAHDRLPHEITLDECPQLGQNQGMN